MTTSSERTIILNLLRGAVPERAHEITEYWQQFDPRIEVLQDARGTVMNACVKRIQFDLKTLRVFWLIGFSGWKSLECYAPSAMLAEAFHISVDQAITVDDKLSSFERDYKERLAAVKTLITTDDQRTAPWPHDIPEPTADRNALHSVQDKVAFDLVSLAVSFIFLHELRRVLFDGTKERPSELAEEEMMCDVWARDILTSKLADYAVKSGHTYADVLKLRSMSLAIAALILYAITPEYDRGGSGKYPSMGSRIEAMLSGTHLPEDSSFWVLTSCLLIGILRQDYRPLPQVPTTAKDLVEKLITEIRG